MVFQAFQQSYAQCRAGRNLEWSPRADVNCQSIILDGIARLGRQCGRNMNGVLRAVALGRNDF
jgi:hypothetical protein